MTVSGFITPFDHLLRLSTLSDQAVNVSSADNFAPDPRSHLLSYHYSCSCCSPHQAVNISSPSSQTSVDADTPQIHNSCLCYSYNFRHCLNMADSLKTMNQELLQTKDWVSPTVPDSQEKFAELPIMDISMIGALPFNTFV